MHNLFIPRTHRSKHVLIPGHARNLARLLSREHPAPHRFHIHGAPAPQVLHLTSLTNQSFPLMVIFLLSFSDFQRASTSTGDWGLWARETPRWRVMTHGSLPTPLTSPCSLGFPERTHSTQDHPQFHAKLTLCTCHRHYQAPRLCLCCPCLSTRRSCPAGALSARPRLRRLLHRLRRLRASTKKSVPEFTASGLCRYSGTRCYSGGRVIVGTGGGRI